MAYLESGLLLHAYAIFLRAGAFVYILPVFGRPAPVMIRVATAVFLATFLVPLTPADPALQMPNHLVDLAIISLREVFIGFLMGFAVQMIFYLCQVAGRLISMEIGLMQSNLFNPLMGDQATVLATGMTGLSIVLIFVLDLHHMILLSFSRSFDYIPAGSGFSGGIVVETVVRSVGNIFLLAVQISAPLIAVNFIVTLSFAILGRAVPNMNVLILSFGARIVVGFSVLIFVFVVLVQFLLGMIQDTPERMLQFLPFQ